MTKKELKNKVKELTADLNQAYQVIKENLREISSIKNEYTEIVSKAEYEVLQKQYEKLQEKNVLLNKLLADKNERRKKPGRKSIITEELIINVHNLSKQQKPIRKIAEDLKISSGLVHKILKI